MICPNCTLEIQNDSMFCPNCGESLQKSNKISFKKINISNKSILSIIAIGIWVLVFQNLGIIPNNQDVRVKNIIDADINKPVDVNLQYINGRSNVFYNNPKEGEKDEYYLIPVTVR